MSKVRLGIIGCGAIGKVHAEAAAAAAEIDLVALADVREEIAREVAQKFSVPKVYFSDEQLLKDGEIDAVALAMPANLRGAIALRALSHGKHILLEKPAAMNLAELDAIERAARSVGVIVAGASCRFRAFASTKVIQDFIATGALGKLRVIRSRAIKAAGAPPQRPPPVWRLRTDLNGGGILVNWGVYELDYLLGLLNWKLRPRMVLAQTWTVPQVFADRAAPGSDAETHFSAMIRCDDDINFVFERSEFTAAVSDEAWQFLGDRGSLRLHIMPNNRQVMFDRADPQRGVITETIYQGDEPFEVMNAGPVRDLAGAILERRPPMTGIPQMRIIQRITEAIYESARTGKCVEIAD